MIAKGARTMQTDVKDITKYETVNEETADAIEEVKRLKADPYKKPITLLQRLWRRLIMNSN